MGLLSTGNSCCFLLCDKKPKEAPFWFPLLASSCRELFRLTRYQIKPHLVEQTNGSRLRYFRQLGTSWPRRCIVTSPLKGKDKADTLVVIELYAVVDIFSGCSLPSGQTNNLLSVKSRGIVIERAAFPLDP